MPFLLIIQMNKYVLSNKSTYMSDLRNLKVFFFAALVW